MSSTKTFSNLILFLIFFSNLYINLNASTDLLDPLFTKQLIVFSIKIDISLVNILTNIFTTI